MTDHRHDQLLDLVDAAFDVAGVHLRGVDLVRLRFAVVDIANDFELELRHRATATEDNESKADQADAGKGLP